MRPADLISRRLHWSRRWLLAWLLDRGCFGVAGSRGQPPLPTVGTGLGGTGCPSPCSFWTPFSHSNDQMCFLLFGSSQTMGPAGEGGRRQGAHHPGVGQGSITPRSLIRVHFRFWFWFLRASVAGRCFMALLSSQDAWEGASEKTMDLRCPSLAASAGDEAAAGTVAPGPATKAGPHARDFFPSSHLELGGRWVNAVALLLAWTQGHPGSTLLFQAPGRR